MDENYAKTTIKASDYSWWQYKIGVVKIGKNSKNRMMS
jgi:hypothetical protein